MKSKREVFFFRRRTKAHLRGVRQMAQSHQGQMLSTFSHFSPDWHIETSSSFPSCTHSRSISLRTLFMKTDFFSPSRLKFLSKKQFSETKSTKLNVQQQQLLRAENFSLYWFLLQLFILISNVFVAAQPTEAKHQRLKSYILFTD